MIILNTIIGIFLIIAAVIILLIIVPVKYNAEIFLKDENINYDFKIMMLFHFILIQAHGINEDINFTIKILFLKIKLKLNHKNNNSRKSKMNKKSHGKELKNYKNYFMKILNKLKPEYLKIEGIYGFYDPCITGMLTGFIYMIKGIFKKAVIVLQPDFLNEVLNIKLHIKGKIRISSLILTIFGILKHTIKNREKKSFKLKTKLKTNEN